MAHGCQIWPLCTLLGHLLALSSGLATPRMSFPLESQERPLQHFQQQNIQNTTTLLLSKDGSTLFVGARDTVLSLDVSQSGVMTMKIKMEWKPPTQGLETCFKKTTGDNCQNFVQVLQPINATHLYACGTFAYNPQDTYIDADSLTMVTGPSKKNDGARGRCPFNPLQRSTAITIDGELFTGTTSDFLGKKPVISRHLSKDSRPDVNLDKDTSISLLNEPTFVGTSSDPADGKVYFFFSEVGKEYSFLEEVRVSRVAQVCKDDIGGKRTLQKSWTSFAKAHLLCKAPKELPFGLIQDMFTLQPAEDAASKEMLFYGVFTSQWSATNSVVCVFGIKEIKAAFTGNYKTFNKASQQFNPLAKKSPDLGKCGLNNASDTVLARVRESFLASDIVTPVGGAPVLFSSDQRYSRVAAMRTQAANGKEYTVLFLLSESGWLHKTVLLDGGPHIVEEIQVFQQLQQMANILLSTSKGVVFIGTSGGVTQVPVSQCPSYKSCGQCILARDPFCGWDRSLRVCARVSSGPGNLGQDVENGDARTICASFSTKPSNENIDAQIHTAVRLKCSKPSNLATLMWEYDKIDPENLLDQSEEGSFTLLASHDTETVYHCVSVENSYEEIIASFNVSLRTSPHSMDTPQVRSRPHTDINTQKETLSKEQGNSGTQERTTSMMAVENLDEDDEDIDLEGEDANPLTPGSTPEIPTTQTHSATLDKILDTVSSNNILENFIEPQKAQSYHSELVVVSLLLAVCVCVFVLGGLFKWRQKSKYGLGRNVISEGETQGFEVCGEKETINP